jgi:hypothetical protein
MNKIRAALYGRISTEQQATARMIENQFTALSERAQTDGAPVPQERQFLDDGYSGATLIRPDGSPARSDRRRRRHLWSTQRIDCRATTLIRFCLSMSAAAPVSK